MDKSNKNICMKIDKNGNIFYRNSKEYLHRVDGPAIEYINGDKYWYKEGQLHRADGPAIEYINGDKYWDISDIHLEEKEFNSWINRIKVFI